MQPRSISPVSPPFPPRPWRALSAPARPRSQPTSCSACSASAPQAALAAAGGLRGVFDDPGDAVREAPFARDHMLRVQAILEVHSRWMEERLRRGGPLGGPTDTRRFIEARVRGRRSEVFGVVYLDNKNRVIAVEELFPGTIDSASVYPREVARRVLVHNAAAVLFFHNHPSGQSQPSNADRVMTGRLTEALALFDVRVLDHLVIGDGEVTSFVELGLM